MAIHFIADLHFNDDERCPTLPDGSHDSAEFARRICRNWRARVAPDDVVWILGNVGNAVHLGTLPGIKHLVRARHDPLPWQCLNTGRYASVTERHVLATPEGCITLVADPLDANPDDSELVLHGGHPVRSDTSGYLSVSACHRELAPVSLAAVRQGGVFAALRQAA
ncbi:phosphoesterase [Novosphingobium panipatense]|jgi:calcineurin-like phosphoesterase family protein|uniref:phosphoesterase n=1 Tax=Novosphingobium TaxID=165696 RepID=UPI000CDA8000|nr:phosphoesterase [Novosphingobium sp. HII-3]